MSDNKVVIVAAINAIKNYITFQNRVMEYMEQNDDDGDCITVVSTILENDKEKPVRIHGYMDNVVAQYVGRQFQENFRMRQSTFEKLLEMVQLEMELPRTKPYISIERDLLATIWILATPDSYRSVSERFDMAKSNLSMSFIRIVNVLNRLSSRIIRWPSEDEMINIENGFHRMAGMKKVIGAIDGTYIKIDAPKTHPEQYVNRKCFHGITLQAICDSSLKFLHCFAGYPSSVHDARIFRNSDIYQDVCADMELFFPANRYLLGDKAYPCLKWCIPPYIDNGVLNREKKKFNTIHAKTRQTVERSFALLFGRFRRLKHLQMKRQDLIPPTVIAACVLHNICLLHENDFINEYIDDAINLIIEIGDSNTNNNGVNNTAGSSYREILCAEINRNIM